jgi:4-amino-4-deoxy-L-arabinose transferase-like glycosyltransferase
MSGKEAASAAFFIWRRVSLRLPRAPIALPLAPAVLAAVALAYILPGVLAHDPWKTEDAIGIGIVHQMLVHGQWLIPHLAGEPYFDDGPLYYWFAALCAKLASPFVAVHDGARLASGLAMAVVLASAYHAGRELYDRAAGIAAALVLLGSLGLLVHAHETLAEMGMLAAQALALVAIAVAPRHAGRAALLLGVGLVSALLSKGPAAVVMPALAALAAPALSERWRSRRYAAALVAGVVIAASVTLGWGLWVEARYPGLAGTLLRLQVSDLGVPSWRGVNEYAQILSWAAWPAWPIAAWALWERRRRTYEPGTRLLVVAAAAALAVVLAHRDGREVHVMPAILPLAVLAGSSAATLRRGAANALAWFGATSAILFGLVVWIGWFAMTTGFPERLARGFTRLEPGFSPHFAWIPFLIALVLSAAWIWLLARAERSTLRGVTYWCCGLVLVWGLLLTLWLPWIDYGKSYRPVALSMQKAITGNVRCIESRGLGEAQRAAFDYHAEVLTVRLERRDTAGCPMLLVQATPDIGEGVGPGWTLVWEGNRPRDHERYRLYRRR